ncbi:MAG: hypothetical protein ACT4QC_01660 [Planctomycetaceae bacterium]
MSTPLRPVSISQLDGALGWRLTPQQLAWGFVGLGVAIRVLRYLLCAPLWIDECLLGENFLDGSYAELLRPLNNDQVAPLGFLWIELSAVRLLGFSEWSLRLFPLGCGIASLFVFRHLASRLLEGSAYVLAVACLAVSKAPIGLSTDAKPYASDLLVALVLLTFAVEWLRGPERTSWLWALALAAPLGLFLSLPAVFVAGAISLALLPSVWKSADWKTRQAWLALNCLVAGAFLLLFRLHVSQQYADKQEFMVGYWADKLAFPPAAVWQFPLWLLDVHTGDKLLAYPYGSENGGAALTIICCVVAGVVLFRRRERTILPMFLSCLGLLFVAAALRRYPYGGHIRLMQFLAPFVCLMFGMGAAALLAMLPNALQRRRGMIGLMCALGIFAAGLSIRNVLQPWEFIDDEAYRAFSQAMWAERHGTVTVCAKTDFQQDLCDTSGYSVPYAFYRCYQRLYSPSHRHGANGDARRLASLGLPARLVVFQPPHLTLDRAAVSAWLDSFRPTFEVIGPEVSTVPQKNEWDMYGAFEVYRLEPRGSRETGVVQASHESEAPRR